MTAEARPDESTHGKVMHAAIQSGDRGAIARYRNAFPILEPFSEAVTINQNTSCFVELLLRSLYATHSDLDGTGGQKFPKVSIQSSIGTDTPWHRPESA